MRFVLFYHSFTSCWNHGNAHFLRGIARELTRRGHDVTVYEPEDGWSRTNAVREHGPAALNAAAWLVPKTNVRFYRIADFDLDRTLDRADVVLVHEWNDPELVAAIGRRRARGGRFVLLFHDTHHRAVTAPGEIGRFELDGYDAVLAFGEVLRQVYLARGWGRRVFTWHEAADTALFHPLSMSKALDLIWIGNWGDGEREDELRRFLLDPIAALHLKARVHGVRYPDHACRELAAHRVQYAGWLPNHRVPAAFARARATVHIPRRPYTQALRGIPTIRVFEALACAIPLICAPWEDAEALFPPGSYLTAKNSEEMTAALSLVLQQPDIAENLARTGLNAIRSRHTCAHRATELFAIIARLSSRPVQRRLGSAEPMGAALP